MPFDPDQPKREAQQRRQQLRRQQLRQYTRDRHEQRILRLRSPEAVVEPEWEPIPASDPLVVSTRALGAIVSEFLVQWEWGKEDVDSYGEDPLLTGLNYLVEHSGVSPRTIYKVTRVESEWTWLDTADRLLTAMGEGPRLTTDPELSPRPNPKWGQEKWMEWRANQGGCVD